MPKRNKDDDNYPSIAWAVENAHKMKPQDKGRSIDHSPISPSERPFGYQSHSGPPNHYIYRFGHTKQTQGALEQHACNETWSMSPPSTQLTTVEDQSSLSEVRHNAPVEPESEHTQPEVKDFGAPDPAAAKSLMQTSFDRLIDDMGMFQECLTLEEREAYVIRLAIHLRGKGRRTSPPLSQAYSC